MEQQIAEAQHCLNCQQPLQGEYCHKCGQHHKIYVRSIFAVLGDLMGELGHWDSRFYRTLRGLFFKPGFLTLEFMRGRHASYVPPLRLYFFMSLVAFVIFSASIDVELMANVGNTDDSTSPNAEQVVIPPAQAQMDIPFMAEEDKQRLNERLRYLTANPDEFVQRLIQLTPQMMLVMLPFWALFLKLIYAFRGRFYLEHLTVALHTHSFILLSLLIAVVVAESTSWLTTVTQFTVFNSLGDAIDTAIFTWIAAYLLLTQKNFYQQTWPITVVKFLLSGLAYTILLSSAFVIMVIYSLLN